jgi:hypothetical protein
VTLGIDVVFGDDGSDGGSGGRGEEDIVACCKIVEGQDFHSSSSFLEVA